MPEKALTFDSFVLIEDELAEIAGGSAETLGWLRSALNDPTAVVCNAPRPLFGEERTILNAPFGFFVTVVHPFGDDQRQRELLWENHRQDATVLRLVTVEEARRLADSMRPDGYDAMPDIWEWVWKDAFYDYFRRGTVELTGWSRY